MFVSIFDCTCIGDHRNRLTGMQTLQKDREARGFDKMLTMFTTVMMMTTTQVLVKDRKRTDYRL